MATKSDFTEDEWKALQKGVTGAGMLASVSDADFTDSFGEASAIARYLGDQSEHAESPLVREIAHVRGTGFGFAASAPKVEAETLEALGQATDILARKAPDAVEAYRQLVLGAAEHAANAKGGLQPAEAEAIEKVRAALG
jgi:hypothetical protein